MRRTLSDLTDAEVGDVLPTSGANMDWQVDTARKRSVDDLSIPIDQHIRSARASVEARADELPELHRRVSRLELRSNDCGEHRHLMRQRRDLQRDADKLKRTIEYTESGRHLEAFDASVAPFLQAYHKNAARAQRPRRPPRRLALPGEDTQTTLGVDWNDESAPQAEVVSEFLTELRQMPPRMKVDREDVCPRCTTRMRLVPAKAVVSCTACGYTASYLDATTSSISYGEEVEFTSFSYKRCARCYRSLSSPSSDPSLLHVLLSTSLTLRIARVRSQDQPLQRMARQLSGEGDDGDPTEHHRPGNGRVSQAARAQGVGYHRTQGARSTQAAATAKDLRAHEPDHGAHHGSPRSAAERGDRGDVPTAFQGDATGVRATQARRSLQLPELLVHAVCASAYFTRACTRSSQGAEKAHPRAFCRARRYKFLQLLGHDELLDRFTLLKGRDKLVKQDQIWKCICEEMDWEYLPSV